MSYSNKHRAKVVGTAEKISDGHPDSLLLRLLGLLAGYDA